MDMIDITSFFRYGSLCGLKVNDPRNQIPVMFPGITFEEVRRKKLLLQRCKTESSDIEFYSEAGIIRSIMVKWGLGESYILSDGHNQYVLKEDINIYHFIEMIEGLEIKWEISQERSYSCWLCIKLESGVWCYFDLSSGELVKIGI
jgi:hypothetical protein